MNEFLRHGSLRRRRLVFKVAKAPRRMLAKRTEKCPACGLMIVKGVDWIVLDFELKAWVHDNGRCRTNDTFAERT